MLFFIVYLFIQVFLYAMIVWGSSQYDQRSDLMFFLFGLSISDGGVYKVVFMIFLWTFVVLSVVMLVAVWSVHKQFVQVHCRIHLVGKNRLRKNQREGKQNVFYHGEFCHQSD